MKTRDDKRFGSIFDQWKDDPEFKKDYDKEFKEFAVSELLLALMDEDNQSVRRLAELAGVAPATIQNLRSGKKKDVKLSNFVNIIEACGYGLEIVKGSKRIPLNVE